jgi:hypothetical protein
MIRKSAIAAAFIVLFPMLALAQQPAPPPPTGVRGTVEKLDGELLQIKSRDGKVVTVAFPAAAPVQTLVKKSVAELKPGDVVASSGVKDAAGKLHAVEVRIMPRPWADGGRQFAWDLRPDSVMTNATVGTVTQMPQGRVVKVSFSGGEAEFDVGPDVPVMAPGPGDRSLLQPGVAVMVFAAKQPDGALAARAVYVEKDGVKPPM